MRILVTGATGFIGQNLIPHLLAQHERLAILVRPDYGTGKQLPVSLSTVKHQLDIVYADLADYEQTREAIFKAGPTHVIHLAAVGASRPFLPVEASLEANLKGTINLVRGCFEHCPSTQQLIVARTPGESSALNVYAASKAAAWTFCRMYARTQGWPVHGAVIFQAYGPGQSSRNLVPSAFAAALDSKDFSMTAGTQARDWIHVADVVDGLISMVAAPLHPGASVDLGTGRATSVREVVERIYCLVGQGGRPLIGALPDRPGEVAIQIADSERTCSLVGWQPRLSLAEGLTQLHTHLLLKRQ